MITDFRLAWRALRAAPGYALAAICCLALGMGANAAVFQLADAIYFRPPPGVRDPAHLLRVTVRRQPATTGAHSSGFAIAGVSGAELTGGVGAPVQALAAYESRRVPVGRGNASEERGALFVAPGYFATLGASPARGRAFGPDEERGAGVPVAIVSDRYWTATLGGDPGAIGRTIVVYDHPVTVVGVAPRGFVGVDLLRPADLWFPLAQASRIRGVPEDPDDAELTRLDVIARVNDGVAPPEVASRLRTAFTRARPEVTIGRTRFGLPKVDVAPLRFGDWGRARPGGRLTRWLASVSVLVLVVACASVAGLVLARGIARQRELAVRTALGAPRSRLVRQLAAEGLTLTALGAGAALSVWAVMAALLRRFPIFPELPDVDVTRTTVVGGAALLAVGMACAVVPALLVTRTDLRRTLQDAAGTASGVSVSRARTREVLLVGQLAFTLMLVAGAGVFLRSLVNALHADLGFDAEHAVLVSAGPHQSLDEFVSGQAAEAVRARAAVLAGVSAASWSDPAPLTGLAFRQVRVPGSGTGAPVVRAIVHADEHFFVALGTRIVRGRSFAAADRPAPGREPQVALVDERMARRDWPGQDPVGRCVQFPASDEDPASPFGRCVTVVGVVADIRAHGLSGEPDTTLYLPIGPIMSGSTTALVVRTSPDPRTLGALRRALIPLVSNAPRLTVQPLADLLDPDFAPHRLGATLFGVYAAPALVLAAVGLHGVVRYTAERRARELAVRTALGARPGDLVRLVAGGGARLALVGGALGVAGAIGGGRLLAGVLYGVRPADPIAVVGACAVLALVTLVAAWVPARRAAHADPAAALRAE